MRWACGWFLWMMSCGGSSELLEPTTPAEAPSKAVESAPSLNWSSSWPVDKGLFVSKRTGVLIGEKGVFQVGERAEICGNGFVLSDQRGGILLTQSGTPTEFPKSPAVQAAFVERAGWRLGELLGKPKGILPGGEQVNEPALHQGIRVRSVAKTRRSGPPWMTIVGQRGPDIGVLLTDKSVTKVFASTIISHASVPTMSLRTLPVWDVDGDGDQELVIYADRPDGGGLRAVVDVELSATPSVSLEGLEVSEGSPCP